MKTLVLVIVTMILVLAGPDAGAQFKSQAEQSPSISGGLIREPGSSLFMGWFNPERFRMSHSFSLSYQTGGGEAFSLGTYTNSMMYQFAENLNARADVSLSYSPYNSFSTFNNKNDLSSVYLSRAQLDYKPWDNVLVQFQFRQHPYVNPYYSPFYNPWYRENGF